jgi:hypothetical protein
MSRKEFQMKTRLALKVITFTFAMIAWAMPIPQSRAIASEASIEPVTQRAFPDLIITSIRFTGRPRVVGGSAKVPITVVVKNQGSAPAARFKVALEYKLPDGRTFAVSFVVPGETDRWYPWTDVALGAGRIVTFSGEAVFIPSLHRTRVSLWAIADSCSGDEFMENYCRVEESNENNNKSVTLSVTLP